MHAGRVQTAQQQNACQQHDSPGARYEPVAFQSARIVASDLDDAGSYDNRKGDQVHGHHDGGVNPELPRCAKQEHARMTDETSKKGLRDAESVERVNEKENTAKNKR